MTRGVVRNPRTSLHTLTDLTGRKYRGGMSTGDDDGWQDWPPPAGADALRLKWRRDESGRWVVAELCLSASWVTSGMLRAISLPRLEAQRNEAQRNEAGAGLVAAAWEILAGDFPGYDVPAGAPRQRITRPDRANPEQQQQFYRRVAMAYRQYAQTRPPAPAIAEEAGVPVTTVHRWVREARHRGFLPPGRKGKVG